MKFKANKLVVAFVAASLACSSVPVMASGIPTADVAAVGEAIKNGMKLKEQIDNQVEQIEQLASQVKALTSKGNWGNVARDIAQEALPDEWKNLYKNAGNLAKSKDLLTSKGYNPNADSERLTKHLETLVRSAKDSEKSFKTIQTLMNKVNQTADIKAAQDLQNRIALENMKLQQRQIDLTTLKQMMEVQRDIQDKKLRSHQECVAQNLINKTDKSCN